MESCYLCHSQTEDYQEQVDALTQKGVKVLYCQCNISNSDDRIRMFEEIKREFGQLNALVNNAGVAPNVRNDILDATEDSYDRVMDINLKGPHFLTQLAANYMIEQKQQKPEDPFYIVNITSVSSSVASVNRGEYCISKAGQSMSTQLWAVRLGEFDIPVYEVRPGVIKTDMTSGVTGKYDQMIEDGLCIQKRWGFPEDIGKVVTSMLRGDLGYSTGQVINVDGGMLVDRL